MLWKSCDDFFVSVRSVFCPSLLSVQPQSIVRIVPCRCLFSNSHSIRNFRMGCKNRKIYRRARTRHTYYCFATGRKNSWHRIDLNKWAENGTKTNDDDGGGGSDSDDDDRLDKSHTHTIYLYHFILCSQQHGRRRWRRCRSLKHIHTRDRTTFGSAIAVLRAFTI